MSTTKIPEKDMTVSEPIHEDKTVPTASPSNQGNLSREESHIADLVKEQPKTAAEFSTKTLSKFNLLELPEECRPLHGKKYRYRWLGKHNIEARLNSSIWMLCTRTNSPYIKPHRFKGHGAIEQAGMLLAFAPEEVGKQREALPAERSAALVKHYTKDLPNDEARGFYTPKDTGDEDSEGLIEDKDF